MKMPKRRVLSNDLRPLIEEALSLDKPVTFTVSGTSMRPFMHDKESVVTVATRAAFKRGDAALYKNIEGTLVLHRIERVKNAVRFCGDARMRSEIVKADNVMGVVTRVSHRGKDYDVETGSYRIKVFLWLRLKPFRKILLKLFVRGKAKQTFLTAENPLYGVFFKAVKAALRKDVLDETVSDRAFYTLAKENGLSGSIYPALDDARIDKELHRLFERDFFAYNAVDAKQRSTVEALSGFFNAAAIPHVFLKGVPLKAIYPEPYMRSMGDLDVFVDEKHLNTVHTLLSKHRYVRILKGSPTHNYRSPAGLLIEVHFSLYSSSYTQGAGVLDDIWQHATPENGFEHRLSNAFELAYLIWHAAKHFVTSGIGARTVLDIGLYAKHVEKTIDRETFASLMERMGLTRFAENMLTLSKHYFAIDALTAFGSARAIETPLLQALTDYILRSGTHGVGVSFNNFLGRISTSKSRLLLLIRLTFPSRKNMALSYPVLKRHPYLLLFVYIKRLFNRLFKRPRRTMRRLGQLSVSRGDIKDAKKLYETLGL